MALNPRERLSAFRAIPDAVLRSTVARDMPADAYSEMLAESLLENLNRNALKSVEERERNRAA